MTHHILVEDIYNQAIRSAPREGPSLLQQVGSGSYNKRRLLSLVEQKKHSGNFGWCYAYKIANASVCAYFTEMAEVPLDKESRACTEMFLRIMLNAPNPVILCGPTWQWKEVRDIVEAQLPCDTKHLSIHQELNGPDWWVWKNNLAAKKWTLGVKTYQQHYEREEQDTEPSYPMPEYLKV